MDLVFISRCCYNKVNYHYKTYLSPKSYLLYLGVVTAPYHKQSLYCNPVYHCATGRLCNNWRALSVWCYRVPSCASLPAVMK